MDPNWCLCLLIKHKMNYSIFVFFSPDLILYILFAFHFVTICFAWQAKIRRAELQKARALQSYYEAKAKREKKIKSKKWVLQPNVSDNFFVRLSVHLTTKYIFLRYHRVQKKARRKEFLKQFEEMCKTNPEGALEELKKMELSRMTVCGETWREIMKKWELFGLKYTFLTCFHYRRGCLSNIRTKASGPNQRPSWQNMMIR